MRDGEAFDDTVWVIHDSKRFHDECAGVLTGLEVPTQLIGWNEADLDRLMREMYRSDWILVDADEVTKFDPAFLKLFGTITSKLRAAVVLGDPVDASQFEPPSVGLVLIQRPFTPDQFTQALRSAILES